MADAEEERFIDAVRRYECLWKVGSRVYKDLCAKENSWKKVAEEVSLYKHTYIHIYIDSPCRIGR